MKDTPEDVREFADACEACDDPTIAKVLRSYADLLERLARPVAQSEVLTSGKKYIDVSLQVPNAAGLKAALESYRASMLGEME